MTQRSDFNDFGFTVINESDIESVQRATSAVENYVVNSEEITQLKSALEFERSKVESMFRVIVPLLNNLNANSDRDYIFWPGELRSEVVKNIKDALINIKNQ